MITARPAPRDDDRRHAERIAYLFGTLEPDLVQLDRLYADGAHFTDPFNDVRGIDAIRQVYRHMYDTLEQPHFVVDAIVVAQGECFITWDFRFRMRQRERLIRGASELHFDEQGRITRHQDHWDSAKLYGMLPVLGPVMRWLRRRAGA
jgi:steroid Delta-isomerase